MAEDLQGLLDRIQKDGLDKAQAESSKIIADAKAQAEKIIADAKAESEALLRKASADAAQLLDSAKAELKHDERDILIELNNELKARLERIVRGTVAKAMTPDLMADVIRKMVTSYAEKNISDLDLILPKNECDALTEALKSALKADFESTPDVSFAAGLKIGFRNSDELDDFSEQALTEVICGFAGPKLTAIIKG